MITKRHCEECRAVLDPAKILRCTKCKACFYCSAACQKRNWRLHKRVCSTDPLLRPFIPVEMAIERALKRQPTMEEAPKDAFCYICLEGDGDGKSSKLMRGCACRGDSAGFVHLECLAELAMSKEESGDLQAWSKCGNCKQIFMGALGLEMQRRFWRQHRSSQDLNRRYHSSRSLATRLGSQSEFDAVNQLLDAASACVGNNTEALLSLNLHRAALLLDNGQRLDGLGLLQAMLPEARVCTQPPIYALLMHQIADVLVDLNRNQEAHEMVTELVAFAKAKFGLEDAKTLRAMTTYAVACAKLGRMEEAKANFEDALATQTRVLGREHPYTQDTLSKMRTYGFAEPSG